MLHRIVLGLVVLALLTSCTGIALPETLSDAPAEEIAPLADQQALAEFQLEASGELGVTGEAAVPAPVEDAVNLTDRQALAEFQLEASGELGVGAEAAVPAPVERNLEALHREEYLLDEMTYIDRASGLRVPAPVEDILTPSYYWENFFDEIESEIGMEPAVPAPFEQNLGITPYEQYLLDEMTYFEREAAIEPAAPVPTDDIWFDGDVIIGYGPTNFKMPALETPTLPVEPTGRPYYEEYMDLLGTTTLESEVETPATPARIPGSLKETNPEYYDWLMGTEYSKE